MTGGPIHQKLVANLRHKAVAGESTLEILNWLKDDLTTRGLDPAETAFSMTCLLTAAFDMGLTPARWVASWNEVSEKGHLGSEELVRRLGPLVPRVDDSEND